MTNYISKRVTIPKEWTAEQAHAVSEFLNTIDAAIWEVHDNKIIEQVQRQNEIDSHLEEEFSAGLNDSNDLNDDIPW